MRVPISWLKEFVDIELPVSVISERLNLAGVEVEEIAGIGAFDSKVVVGELVDSIPQDFGEGYRSVLVNVGEHLQAVSTAPIQKALSAGTKLAVATVGAVLLDRKTAHFRLAPVTGLTSGGPQFEALLCSAQELGIGLKDRSLVVVDQTTPVGIPLIEVLRPQPDWCADDVLVLKILANTARVQSILGTAREIAAITGKAFRGTIKVAEAPVTVNSLTPSVPDSQEWCRRFSVAQIDNVTVAESPGWMQRRLVLSGIAPVNNIVDVANYVMIELGQPMHTYDLDQLASCRLGVRLSQEGEQLHTIGQPDEELPLRLPNGIPVIVSDDKPVAIAGVIGGSQTAINQQTTRILLESANFDFISIRKSQDDLKIYTEASSRFSRGVDPQLTQYAIRRFVELLTETCPSLEAVGWADSSLWVPEVRKIQLSLTEVNESLGTQFSLDQLVELLNREMITASIDEASGTLQAVIPSSREDLAIPADLLEEFARLDGYEHVPETLPADPIPKHARNLQLELREAARDALARWGLQEVITYTLTNPESEKKLQLASPGYESFNPPYVRILNPISSERTVMRRTLLPGLLEITNQNLRFTPGCHIFEIGNVILPEVPSESPLLPAEPYRVALLMTGPVETSSLHTPQGRFADFFDAADAVRFLLNHLHIDSVSFVPVDRDLFQPGTCAAVLSGQDILGYVGLVHPLVAEAFDLADHRIVSAELDLDEVIKHSVRFFSIREPARVPSVIVDVSVVVPRQLNSKELVDEAQAVPGDFWRTISVFDVYVGSQIPEGKKAVGLRMELNGVDRTLTILETQTFRDAVVLRLHEKFEAIERE